jgi:hypothetical protein
MANEKETCTCGKCSQCQANQIKERNKDYNKKRMANKAKKDKKKFGIK